MVYSLESGHTILRPVVTLMPCIRAVRQQATPMGGSSSGVRVTAVPLASESLCVSLTVAVDDTALSFRAAAC